MSRCHVRCRHCGKRRVLSKHPDEYRKPLDSEEPDDMKGCLPVCEGCGERDYRADSWMNNRKTPPTCHADCAHYPHRMGTWFCKFLPSGQYRDGEVVYATGIDLPF